MLSYEESAEPAYKIGDTVRLTTKVLSSLPYGYTAKILEVDDDCGLSYKIDAGNGKAYWFEPGEVERAGAKTEKYMCLTADTHVFSSVLYGLYEDACKAAKDATLAFNKRHTVVKVITSFDVKTNIEVVEVD